jgi:flagellar protein FliO/FliZ
MDFDLSTPTRAIIALFLVLALIGVVVWLVRRFSGQRISNAAGRGRQPRLAVVDAAAVDSRRRLVLVRRDNVEHLMMIGGPTDVVVEANIVRAAPAREPGPPRAPAAPEAPPRAVALGEESMWPLQPEPTARAEPAARPEPVVKLKPPPRAEPASRPPRPPPMVEEPAQWAEPEPAPPARESRPRTADPLVGLAQELGRAPGPEEAVAEPPARQAPRREGRAPRPQPAPPAADTLLNPDQNLAEMAQRLEAALRRPARRDEGRSPPAARDEPAAAAEAEGAIEQASPDSGREPARPARGDGRSARPADAPAPQKSLYDSLEQEMASLLGRPGSKP